jgi:hypothetical protein
LSHGAFWYNGYCTFGFCYQSFCTRWGSMEWDLQRRSQASATPIVA